MAGNGPFCPAATALSPPIPRPPRPGRESATEGRYDIRPHEPPGWPSMRAIHAPAIFLARFTGDEPHAFVDFAAPGRCEKANRALPGLSGGRR